MAFQLQQRLCETENITPTVLVIALCPRILLTPASDYAIIAAAKWKPWRISRNFAWEFLLSPWCAYRRLIRYLLVSVECTLISRNLFWTDVVIVCTLLFILKKNGTEQTFLLNFFYRCTNVHLVLNSIWCKICTQVGNCHSSTCKNHFSSSFTGVTTHYGF